MSLEIGNPHPPNELAVLTDTPTVLVHHIAT